MGNGVKQWQARAFALAQPKKRNSLPRGKRLKRWGVVIAIIFGNIENISV
jgi:hypothetical protein